MSDDKSIAEKREDILERIAAAAKRAGRPAADVTLVAVSKVQPDERIADMLKAGQRVFGENRVQEAQARWGERFAERRENIELRLIGPLQTNKAEEAVKLFDVIETLDREKLAKALLKAADKAGRLPRLLVQVNTGDEVQKSGIAPKDLGAFLARLKSEYAFTPEGLMCIPPQDEAASPHFWLLKTLADENGLKTLSMGMSQDFETAIEVGASHVRVGSALFGARI
ncbi:MAG: YggS family pyridoxal phosphate-dependent enzyme [Robiginitomaculum sp.]